MRLFLLKLLVIVAVSTLLQGCEGLRYLVHGDESEQSKNECSEWKSSDDDDADCIDWDAAKFRSHGQKAMDAGNYEKAIKVYEAMQSRYPFGTDSAQAQLDIAYAYYKNSDPDASIAAADRFIKMYPRSPNIDYAYYLKGLVNYNRDITFSHRFLPTDASQRDPASARNSYDIFAELVRRFPNSKYVPDAKKRMIALKNNLAMHDIHIARYYMKRRAYVAAANRSALVVEKYQRTPAVPYALQIMQEAYTKLNMQDEAQKAELLYKTNFPNGPDVNEHPTIAHEIWDFIGLED